MDPVREVLTAKIVKPLDRSRAGVEKGAEVLRASGCRGP